MAERRFFCRARFQQLLAAVPGLFAGLVLIGWTIGSTAMTHLWFSPVSMNPASAVALICFSFGLLLQPASRSASLRAPGNWLFLAAAGIGALTLADDLFGGGIRPDVWLFASKLSIPHARPSRIAPNAALCMVLMSVAFLLIRSTVRPARVAAQSLSLATILLSGFALVGHLYGVAALYTMPQFFPMAAHTAVCFIALGAHALIDTSDFGFAGMLADKGPAGGMMRRLLPAAILLPIGFGWLGVCAIRAGAFPYDVGVALIAVASLVAMTALVSLTAVRLRASDLCRQHAEHELRRLARTDSLTGLPNRTSFMETLMGRMSPQRRRNDGDFAIVYMDLDGFKGVNDTLGHPAGDRLLQMVADHLRACVRPHDVVARLGGDEFTMLLDRVCSSEDAMRVAERVVSGMPKHITIGGRKAEVGISVGIVVSEPRHVSLDAMLSEADQALYTAKQNGRGRAMVYVPELAVA
jgi:diguanylate cyclase (GGDEF)-like protein